jgi:hypothetical protein
MLWDRYGGTRTADQGFTIEGPEGEKITGNAGSLPSIKCAVEYVPWKHFGVGLGVDTFAK